MGVRISEVFGGAFLCGEDFPPGKSYRLVVGEVRLEKFDDGDKPVLHFQNARKSMVLNKTNGSAIAAVLGDDTEAWYGAELELFTTPVTFNGRTYNGIRCRVLAPPAAGAAPAEAQQQPTPVDDEIPF